MRKLRFQTGPPKPESSTPASPGLAAPQVKQDLKSPGPNQGPLGVLKTSPQPPLPGSLPSFLCPETSLL